MKLAEGSLKTSKRRCFSEDILNLCKTLLLGVRNAEWFSKKANAQNQGKRFQRAIRYKCTTIDGESS